MVDLRYLWTKQENANVSDSSAPQSSSAPLDVLLGFLANRVKAITGESSWLDSPDITLSGAASGLSAEATTRADADTTEREAREAHEADRTNPHRVTWAQVPGKPTAFNPSSHKNTHATGGSDAIAPADIGAATEHSHPYAPASHVDSRDGHPPATQSGAGFLSAADKTKLDNMQGAGAALMLSAPIFDFYDLTLAVGTWTLLGSPSIEVPALGNPPQGTTWMISLNGFLRLDSGPQGMVYVGGNINRQIINTVHGGGHKGTDGQDMFPLSGLMAAPGGSAPFTVDFTLFVLTAGTYRIRTNPNPYVEIKAVRT